MNHVLLVGLLEQEPELRPDSDDTYSIELWVRRRGPSGAIEPGSSLLEVVIPRDVARRLPELHRGGVVAVAGLIVREEFRGSDGGWRSRYEIVADWIEAAF